jgi:hypothetical protein
MNTLTRVEVETALQRPIEQVDGKWACRICPARFDSKRSVPVHELKHRRVVGLAPPPSRGGLPQTPRYVVCNYDGCTDRMFRTSLPTHLRSKKHGLSQAQASFYARQRGEEDVRASMEVVVIEEDISGAPPSEAVQSPMTDLLAVEAITGILSAARSDGVIPVRLLPAAYNLIGHTEAVLDELRRLTEGP